MYSTHSHSSETPRFRLVVPLSRDVTPDEYIPIARRLAEYVGIDAFDDSTYQPERLMYWPSCSSDGEKVFLEGDGDAADADALLGSYTDWRDVSEWPVSKRVQRLSAGHGPKQEDPTAKGGLIGAFCRTYSISEAIAAFLSDVYEPTGQPDRYTYKGGSTEAGAVVYEDKWLYSHHGTDPCCEREVNAFDLVRIHLFGADDAESDPDTPVNRLPSFARMESFAKSDARTNKTLNKELFSSLQEDFGDMSSEGGGDWIAKVRRAKKGLEATPANYGIILRNDPRIKGCVRFDSFRGRSVIQRDLPWRSKAADPYWSNSDDANLVGFISRAYNNSPVTKTVLLDEWDAVVSGDCYHPVRDYLEGLVWDGRPRLDTLLPDYLGAEDNELTRAMMRKHLCAAVARILHPGIKYDYVLTLVGPEGIGKSSLIRALGGEWFDDSFSSGDVGSKDAMEQLRGRWLIEMGELKDYKKSTVESFKAFISKQDDQYRPAYGRKTEIYRRQCVFFATTNERGFLKGDTGNRRFWAVEVGKNMPALDVFDISKETVDQIWAEACERLRQGERLFLPGMLEKQARARQSEFNEIRFDDRIGVIAGCIRRHLPVGWYSLNRKERRDFYRDAADMADGEPFIRRETICAIEVSEEFFGLPYDRYRSKEINQIFGVLGFEPMGSVRGTDKEYGQQRRWKIPAEFYDKKGLENDPKNPETDLKQT
jgi:Predicted P-loop ATPase and inactivated derivatives